MSEQQISKTCSNLNVYYISGVLFTKQHDLFDLLFKVSVNPIIDHFSKNNFLAPSEKSYIRLEIVDSNLNMSAKKRKSSCPFARKKKTSEEPQRKFGKKSFKTLDQNWLMHQLLATKGPASSVLPQDEEFLGITSLALSLFDAV